MSEGSVVRRGALALISFLLASAGCSSEQLYDFGRDLGKGKARCEELTSPDERASCEQSFAKDHERYEAEREAVREKRDMITTPPAKAL